MNRKYIVATALALAGVATYFFLKKKETKKTAQPQKENERHHLTTAFSKAKQMATGG